MLSKIKAMLTGGCVHEYKTTGENIVKINNNINECLISTYVRCNKCGDKVLIKIVSGLVIDKVSNSYVNKFKRIKNEK